MTGDTFRLVLGGHSAAAGHGAGFNQSHVIEAGHVLEPVFAHLGVEFRAYNFAQGGMGTFQQAREFFWGDFLVSFPSCSDGPRRPLPRLGGPKV